MNKGTIIYVGAFEMPDKNAAAHRVSTIGKIFNSLGYHTVFLGRVDEGEHFKGVRKSGFSDDVFEISAPASTKEWIKYMFDTSAIKTVVEKCESVKMIILYDMPYFNYIATKKAFSKRGIKVVYDCAEWANATEGNVIKRCYKKFDDMLIRKRLAKKADGIICISNMMLTGYKANMHLLKLPPMVDINDPIWHQDKIDHKDKFEFCFAGSVGSNKESIDVIVSSFSKIKNDNLILRIIGVEKQAFIKNYPSLLTEAEDERIIFMGRLSHEETVRYILSCDCYIFIRESNRKNNAGFPTKFVESFTCCVLIITTDTSDIKSYIENNNRGIVLDSVSGDKIQKAMEKFVSSSLAIPEIAPDDTFYFAKYMNQTKKWLDGLMEA